MRFIHVVYPASLILVLLISACYEREPKASPWSDSFPKDHYFTLHLENSEIQVQLAINQSESTRGLMFRKALAPNHGMLFIYPRAKKRNFWMRNTGIPLDIGYFTSNGILQEIHPMYPHTETSVSSINEQIQFALEMNQGWFARNKIKRGCRLNLEEIRKALAARGFNPDSYNIQ
ncbi:MAG: hypothetical protein DF168_01375 [Candidatus Moanabacter tarae]|uniref:DUF192 domain-containing protein n=1 Tax=Candidatus Moanibacter tarae TaxID=2200854 RepID=A0A2Z4AD82_9BACT|nr:MAG: hypothetical protein DF168_01375 [Candidatus Moanabacter tarae]|tara:strand:+ start:976 stop:1500 length:525 start_codon:yes stop_codon:yes gene_type:complete